MHAMAQEILEFWLDEVGPDGWYDPDAALDARIRSRFEPAWQKARQGAYHEWRAEARSSLALLVLLDQFPRNMFRDGPLAFTTDARALAVAKSAIARGHDQRIDPPARQFFYLPLMHSERVADQERSVRLFVMNGGSEDNLTHARAHRDVIRRFGRFPSRNAALGRQTTAPERKWLDAGGYKAALAG